MFRCDKSFFYKKNAKTFAYLKKKQYLCTLILQNCGKMSESTKHIVQLDTLEIGEHLFDFQLDSSYFSAIENSELLGGMVDVKACLDLREDDFSVDIDILGQVQVTCDRCLDAMDVEVDVYEEELEFEEDTKQIDLAWLAYELIIVNLPLVHSHQEGGCNPEMDALLQNHLCTQLDDEE